MKSQSEILKMLGWEKSSSYHAITRQYQNFIKLINEIENDIINKEVQGENFIFSTSYGSYQFSVPENTDFHTYITVLLKIQTESVKNEIEVENTIFVENEIVQSITKAKKFTTEKMFRDITKYVFLNFTNDKIQVISTNAHAIYKSQKFNFISDKKIENFILPIALNDLELCKTAKNEFLKIDIIDKENVLINDKKAKIQSNLNFNQLLNFSFESDGKMEFSKSEMQKNLKSLKPLLDYRNSINFHLNGSIQIKPITDKETKTEVNFEYLNKDFDDLDFNIGFNDFNTALSVLNSKNILYQPKENYSILTNEKDSVLIINQKI